MRISEEYTKRPFSVCTQSARSLESEVHNEQFYVLDRRKESLEG